MPKNTTQFLKLFILLLPFILPPTVLYGEPESPLPQKESQGEGIAKPPEKTTTIIEFYTWAGLLPKDLVDLQAKISVNAFLDQIEKELPLIALKVNDLKQEMRSAKTSSDLQIMQVDNLQLKLNRIQNQLNKSSKPLTETLTRLSLWRSEWVKKKETLSRFEQEEQLKLALAIEQKETLSQIIKDALDLIESYLAPSLVQGKAIADLQVQLHTMDNDLRELDTSVRKASTQQTSPSILSLGFYKRINSDLFEKAYSNALIFLQRHQAGITNNWKAVFISLFVLTTLSTAIAFSKKLVSASSRWYPFSQCPGATAVFMLTTFYELISQLILNLKPGYKWDQILNVLTILAVIRLLRYCIDKTHIRDLLKKLSWFMAITILLMTIELPQLLILFFVFYASIAAFLIYAYQLKFKSSTTLGRWIRRSWGILPLLIILTGIAGYDQFAINAFATLLNSVWAFLVIWMLYRLNSGLLGLLLLAIPFTLLRDNLPVVVKSLQPFIAWLHGFLLIAVLAVIWNLYPSVDSAIIAINGMGLSLGDFSISPGFILTVIFVLYGALLFSRAIQALLLKEILPRYKVGKGVQLSITRLIHYAIVTIGFFIMLKVLGFELKQLTILGGALGIGIGFGLQAIVTNFAGGLILLFERPIKIGDTIQIGADFGEVKTLGLRATIIQTFDNAEIVIPNSDLITGQVTNWTLAERRVRVKIPVGVAYGTDVSKVLEILTSCANENPMTMSTPAPTALFLAFGASSLDFELRVWIPEFLDKLTVTSDLNQAIEEEFALNNIEIPFQQTDLHIRTVDQQAARALYTGVADGKES